MKRTLRTLIAATLVLCCGPRGCDRLMGEDFCVEPRPIPNPLVIVTAGQSNMHYAQPGVPVYSTTGRVTINRQYLVQSDFYIPTVGDPINHSSAMMQFGDMLVTRFNIDVIIVVTSIGSTTSTQWAGGSTHYWDRISGACVDWQPDLILWNQGEGDALETQATTYQNYKDIITQANAAGCSGVPFFVSINSSDYGGHQFTGIAATRLAQYQVIGEGYALAGPDTDQIRAVNDWIDGLHFVGEGFHVHALMWFGLIKAYFGYTQ